MTDERQPPSRCNSCVGVPDCRCEEAHVWRMSCQRKFSMPARLSAFLQAFVLVFASGFPAYVNTLCGCLPSCRRNTSSAVAFSGTAIGLRFFDSSAPTQAWPVFMLTCDPSQRSTFDCR